MNQRKAGVLLSYVSLAINSIINFIYIPMLLSFLSKEQYGLYQMIGALVAYIGTMDFGLADTTTRYYSKYFTIKRAFLQQKRPRFSIYIFTYSALFFRSGKPPDALKETDFPPLLSRAFFRVPGHFTTIRPNRQQRIFHGSQGVNGFPSRMSAIRSQACPSPYGLQAWDMRPYSAGSSSSSVKAL